MSLEEIIKYYGTLAAASRAVGVSKQATSAWRKKGYIPLLQQYRFAELTEGELMPDVQNPAQAAKKRLENSNK